MNSPPTYLPAGATVAQASRVIDGAGPSTAAAPTGPVAPQAVDRQFAINLARGLLVLRAFTPTEPMLGNRELSQRTGLAKATISRLTYTLTLLGYLSHSEKYQRYRLGPGVLSLGYPMLASMQIRQIARPFMERLARDTRCTVNLGMRDRLNVVYIDTCRPEHDNSANPDIGSTRPLLTTALGRALLLGGPESERQPALNRLRLDNPEAFAIDVKFWEADQKLFAERGYCQSNGDWRKDIHAVAVPVRQPLHEEGLAINCTIVSHRLKKDLLEREVAPLLLGATLEIERACGLQ